LRDAVRLHLELAHDVELSALVLERLRVRAELALELRVGREVLDLDARGELVDRVFLDARRQLEHDVEVALVLGGEVRGLAVREVDPVEEPAPPLVDRETAGALLEDLRHADLDVDADGLVQVLELGAFDLLDLGARVEAADHLLEELDALAL